jgi:Ni,Fe-hydrogenase III large subunit
LDIALNTNTFIKRAEGVGILPYKVAKAYSVLGPTARASGRSAAGSVTCTPPTTVA